MQLRSRYAGSVSAIVLAGAFETPEERERRTDASISEPTFLEPTRWNEQYGLCAVDEMEFREEF